MRERMGKVTSGELAVAFRQERSLHLPSEDQVIERLDNRLGFRVLLPPTEYQDSFQWLVALRNPSRKNVKKLRAVHEYSHWPKDRYAMVLTRTKKRIPVGDMVTVVKKYRLYKPRPEDWKRAREAIKFSRR